MSNDKSKTEYLKRYLEDGKKKRKKPKKTVSNPLIPKVKILDENIDVKSIKFGGEEIIEEEEEAPIVAEVIDDRPEEIKIQEVYKPSKWKRLGSTADENGESNADKNKNNSFESKNRSRHDSDSDYSPSRKNQNRSSRMRHDSGSDLSPHRKSSLISNTRKERHDSNSDCSPPRRNVSFSQGKRRNNSDSDISPPRISQNNEEHRHKRTKESSNIDKHKKQNSDSDLSPDRTRLQRSMKHSDSDLSPPRAKESSRSDKDARSRPTQTLSGLKAGLQNAATLRRETQELRDRERKQINQLDEELSGRNAETIVRDRKSGKKRDIEEENHQKLEKEKQQAELQQKYAQWGKGIEQSESQKHKLTDDLYESTKPLARYHGDEDLEEQLKAQIHDDDPMAEYIKKKKKKENISAFPEYKGPPPPPNRFGIKPGYRWDGVDRSNGFERKYFEKISNTKAVQDEAYLWSVQDM